MSSRKYQPSRRQMLQSLATGILGLFSLNTRGEEKKMSPPAGLKKRPREKFKYQDSPVDGRSCARCMLYFGNGQCAIIEGEVSPDGWCNQWVPPTVG
jgi:High potential iron-sulfur protein